MNSRKKIRLGIISALAEEQQGLIEAMQAVTTLPHGMRDYILGQLWNIDAVCVLSRIGKVAAAMTAAILVEKFGVTHIVFTGVAVSADARVKIGDIVVSETCVQHDMDARPLFPRFEVPLTNLSSFQSDKAMSDDLASVAAQFLQFELAGVISEEKWKEFGMMGPRVHRGLIGSGDQFINNRLHLSQLKESLPALLAVEMEGRRWRKCVLSWACRSLSFGPCQTMPTKRQPSISCALYKRWHRCTRFTSLSASV